MPPSSPEDRFTPHINGAEPHVEGNGIQPGTHEYAPAAEDEAATHVQGTIDEPPEQPDAHTHLLYDGRRYHLPNCGDPDCDHGTWSPKPRYQRGYGSFAPSYVESEGSREGYGGPPAPGEESNGRAYRGDYIESALGDAVTDGLLGRPNKRGTTHTLASKYGIKHERIMYASPFTASP
jgi:hypothetical protein